MTNTLEIETTGKTTIVRYGNRAAKIIQNGGNPNNLVLIFLVNTRESIHAGQVVSSPRRHFATLAGAIKTATKFVIA